MATEDAKVEEAPLESPSTNPVPSAEAEGKSEPVMTPKMTRQPLVMGSHRGRSPMKEPTTATDEVGAVVPPQQQRQGEDMGGLSVDKPTPNLNQPADIEPLGTSAQNSRMQDDIKVLMTYQELVDDIKNVMNPTEIDYEKSKSKLAKINSIFKKPIPEWLKADVPNLSDELYVSIDIVITKLRENNVALPDSKQFSLNLTKQLSKLEDIKRLTQVLGQTIKAYEDLEIKPLDVNADGETTKAETVNVNQKANKAPKLDGKLMFVGKKYFTFLNDYLARGGRIMTQSSILCYPLSKLRMEKSMLVMIQQKCQRRT